MKSINENKIILNVKGIDVFYGPFQALWDVSLQLKIGEIVTLIGPNTAGKSTLLSTISGILHPIKGIIEFEGITISSLDTFEIVNLGNAHIPEGRRIFPEMTVLANLTLGSYTNRARRNKEQNLKKIFQLFPILKDRKKQLAKTLSGGEQQMLAIARGLMSEPKLILIDEMSLGLAPIVVEELYSVLKEIRKSGVSILFVDQNVRRSLEGADKAYIIKKGRIVLSGDTSSLKEEDIVKTYFGT